MDNSQILAVVSGYDKLIPYMVLFFGFIILIGIPLKLFNVLRRKK